VCNFEIRSVQHLLMSTMVFRVGLEIWPSRGVQLEGCLKVLMVGSNFLSSARKKSLSFKFRVNLSLLDRISASGMDLGVGMKVRPRSNRSSSAAVRTCEDRLTVKDLEFLAGSLRINGLKTGVPTPAAPTGSQYHHQNEQGLYLGLE
jgi:hypothetical protein